MGAPQAAGPAFVFTSPTNAQIFASGQPAVFAANGALYVALNTIGTGGGNINGTGVFKSTDGGNTWNQMDAAHAPTSAVGCGFHDTTGNRLIFGLVTITFPASQQATFLQDFDFSTDTWGAAYATGGPVAFNMVMFTFERPDTSVVIVYDFGATNPAGTSRLRAAVWKGSAWSSSIDLGVGMVALQANGQTAIADCAAAMDASGNIDVAFDNTARSLFMFAQLTSANAVTNFHQFTETFQNNLNPYGTMVISGNAILISALANAGVNNMLLVGTGLTSPVWTDLTPAALQPANLDKAGSLATDGTNLVWMINFFDPVTFDDIFQLAKSTDGGQTWTVLPDNMTAPYFYDFSSSPLAPNTDPSFGITSTTVALISPGGTPTWYGFCNVHNSATGVMTAYFMNSETVGPAPGPAPTKLEISLFGIKRLGKHPEPECSELPPIPKVKRVM